MSLRTHELIAELRSRGVAFVIISVCLDESYSEQTVYQPPMQSCKLT
jgi:hypothetical protein